MNRRVYARIAVCFLSSIFLAPQEPLAQKMDRIPGLHQLMPGHYIYILDEPARGASSSYNCGIIVTDEGVVVVDALGSVEAANKVRSIYIQMSVHSLETETAHPTG